MYDVTNILDICQLEADKHKESKCGSMVETASGCLQPLLLCLRNPLFTHKIGSRIKELNQQLEDIHKEVDKYMFNIGLGSNPEPRNLTAAELSSSRTSSKFDKRHGLRIIIENAGGDHGGKHNKSTLTETLINNLSTGRFLLVMDDVWSHDAWNHVLSVPVRNASKKLPGSRVHVTTRSAHLPQQMQAPLHQHRVRPLENDDAWSLLKKQLQPNQVAVIDQLKTIAMEIIENCDGLLVAIKMIGGLLSTRYPSEEIIRDVVTQMWISEGFIQALDGSSTISQEYEFEEMATESYRELIKRNLIQPTKEYSLTGYGCTMHDVVRTFAEYVAREEPLVVIGREQAATGGVGGGGIHVRRLSVEQTVSVVEWGILQRRESHRTLIINSRVNFDLPGFLLGSFSCLRVLYIWSANSDTLVPSLSKLKHLRYLHLEDTDISRLPDDIHKMKFLLYINLLGCKKLGHLPSKIIKLVHLRSLDTSSSNIGVVPKAFGGLTNLRLFYGFPVQMDMDASGSSGCSLQELAPPSQLRIESLHSSVEFKSLRYLWLQNLPCWTHLPDGLCCLPSLEMLTIIDAPAIKRIGPQFQASSSMAAGGSTASTSAPFPKLRQLYLDGLCEWEEWDWNDCEEHRDMETTIAMPCLRELYLYELSNLTHVENFPSVVDLDVFDCPELKRISGLPMLQKIRIVHCTKLEVLEGVPALDSLELEDPTMDTLPEYLRDVSPRYLELICNKKLHASSLTPGSSEWNKISHIKKHNIVCIRD
ncbi:unnamed protein product [Miscanthus lutarioriparius]|uniref:NB-ARC domain-containing protein n=1 Tax=Miscanthus lutarioriparius TaxID=422564 RepID=A0A811QFE9_9POAL|nr:unnamed protein product [Miscanthus lutarioriparius]